MPPSSILVLSLLALVSIAACLTSCPVSTCDPNDPNLLSVWMNSSVMAAQIRGVNVTIWPLQLDGELFTNASLLYSLLSFQELNVSEADYLCNLQIDTDLSFLSGLVLQSIVLSECCCELSSKWEIIEGTTSNKTSTVYNITSPAMPQWNLVIEYSLVNETVDIEKNASYGTFYAPYNITYSTDALKLSLQMNNWPWKGLDRSVSFQSSYLKLFVAYGGVIDGPAGGSLIISEPPQYFSSVAYGQQTVLDVNLLSIFTADGVDWDTQSNSLPQPITFPGLHNFWVNASFEFCHGERTVPHFTTMEYDPSLSALFAPLPPSPPGSPAVAPSNPSSPAAQAQNALAIILPVVLIVAAICVVFVIVYIKSPWLRSKINPFSVRNQAELSRANQVR